MQIKDCGTLLRIILLSGSIVSALTIAGATSSAAGPLGGLGGGLGGVGGGLGGLGGGLGNSGGGVHVGGGGVSAGASAGTSGAGASVGLGGNTVGVGAGTTGVTTQIGTELTDSLPGILNTDSNLRNFNKQSVVPPKSLCKGLSGRGMWEGGKICS